MVETTDNTIISTANSIQNIIYISSIKWKYTIREIKHIKQNQRKKLTNEEEGNKPSIYFVRPIPSDLD